MGGLEAVEKMNIEGEDVVRRHRQLRRVLRLARRRKVPLAHERALHALRRRGPRKKFLKEAEAAGLESLKGHRSVGGARASIYNAMPMEGVQALVDFMAEFKKNN